MFQFFIISFFLLYNKKINSQCTNINTCLPKDSNGFTIFESSIDSQIIYVSFTTGDDDLNDGLSINKPFKTLAKGYDLLRTGYPDQLLMKRGDEWDECLGFQTKGGRSKEEPMVIGSYGEGERPVMYITSGSCLSGWTEDDFKHVVYTEFKISGKKDLYNGNSGMRFLGPAYDVHIEDVVVEETSNIIFQNSNGPERTISDITLRRNIIYQNYPRGSGHVQGMYTSHVENGLIEENLWYHNGWTRNYQYWQNNGYGNATMFNHNCYLSTSHNMVIRNNLYIRPSSMNIKFRCDESDANDIMIIENNLFWGGEVSVGLGGNTDNPYRFHQNNIKKNVFIDVGERIPVTGWLTYTHRVLGWMLNIQDNSDTSIVENLFIHGRWATNSYAIKLGGTLKNILIQNNVMAGLKANNYLDIVADTHEGFFNVYDNVIQDMDSYGGNLIDYQGDSIDFKRNKFFSSASSDMNDWFSLKGGIDINQWMKNTNSHSNKTEFPDSRRSLETYCEDILKINGHVENFVEEALKQSKKNWRNEYSAIAINSYLREGYGLEPLKENKNVIIIVTVTGSILFLALFVIILIMIICGIFYKRRKKQKNGEKFIEISSKEEIFDGGASKSEMY